jgi:hypothetical protein
VPTERQARDVDVGGAESAELSRWCLHRATLSENLILNSGEEADMVESDQTVERAYVGGDEWREAPRRHRSVHGGFEGTHTRFRSRSRPRSTPR